MYDYKEAMMNDLRDYVRDNVSDFSEFENADDLANWLNENCWNSDSVTGNASGSYTFNSYKARDYVLDNMDLLEEVAAEFCLDDSTVAKDFLSGNWEYFDVTIRCYMLSACAAEVAEEYADDIEEAHSDDEEMEA